MPEWATHARFDIDAKDSTTGPAVLQHLTNAQSEAMMQGLLAERFGLKSHTEMRSVPAYELVFVRPSPALKQVDKPVDSMRAHNRHLEAEGIRIAQLLNLFSNELHRPVVDHTDLTPPTSD